MTWLLCQPGSTYSSFCAAPWGWQQKGLLPFLHPPPAEFSGLQTVLQPLLNVSRVPSCCFVQMHFVSIFINKETLSGRKKNKKEKKTREVRDLPSEWDLADLLKACLKGHTTFQVVREQKECCTNSPSSQTDVQNRFFTADEMAIFCHVTVSWGAVKHFLTSV